MSTCSSYPHTGRFVDAQAQARFDMDEGRLTSPKIRYRGTVKVHGTHCDLVFRRSPLPDGGQGPPSGVSLTIQSRNRVISPSQDNAGSAAFLVQMPLEAELLPQLPEFESELMVAGEIAGKGLFCVGVSKLEKFFVIFAVRVDGRWVDLARLERLVGLPQHRVYNILQFGAYELTVDFGDPVKCAEALEEARGMVAGVEAHCPVAHGVGGIVGGIGEGIVFVPVDMPRGMPPAYWFKVKGTMHEPPQPDPQRRELAQERRRMGEQAEEDARVLVESLITPRRLQQGLEYLDEMRLPRTPTSLRAYVKWAVEDALREHPEAVPGDKQKLQALRKAMTRTVREHYLDRSVPQGQQSCVQGCC
jgi:hypothetical protein